MIGDPQPFSAEIDATTAPGLAFRVAQVFPSFSLSILLPSVILFCAVCVSPEMTRIVVIDFMHGPLWLDSWFL